MARKDRGGAGRDQARPSRTGAAPAGAVRGGLGLGVAEQDQVWGRAQPGRIRAAPVGSSAVEQDRGSISRGGPGPGVAGVTA
jgi:hypothetical protein